YAAIGITPGPSFSDRGLGNSTTYYYVVSVVTALGQSPNSSETNVTPLVAPVLQAPSGLLATGRNAQNNLSWNDVVAGSLYVVYRSTSTGGPYAAVSMPSASDGLTDDGL